MALKRVDEFDEKSDAEVVTFSIDGNDFEIDLSSASKQQLYRDLERYINAARRIATRSSKKLPKKTSTSRPAAEPVDNDAVRTWARSTGKKVSDRGRIPKDIVDEFKETHAPNGVSPVQPAFSGV